MTISKSGSDRAERRLVAVLAADVEGYSRHIGRDDKGAMRMLLERRTSARELIGRHNGRTVDTTGDSILAEFPSAQAAVECALDIQRTNYEVQSAIAEEARMNMRIGIHLGDVVIHEHELFGDGVNIAARLQSLAEPGGVCVSGAVWDQVRRRLPLQARELGLQPMKNIAEPVPAFNLASSHVPGGGSANDLPPLALPDKPSIAVLPFTNMSGDPEQEYFVDGMIEEIITALSRIRWLFVIARNSTFTYKGQSIDVKRVGRELGVRYVLEGSVRKDSGRVRIAAQLIEAETGAHLWADRFDGTLEDVFELQDKIAISVAGVIEPTLRAAETRRATARPSVDLSAYDLYLRALPVFYTLTKEGILAALTMFKQAIARDPQYGPALAWAAMCHLWRHLEGWGEDPDSDRQEGIKLAQRAIEVAGDDATVLANAALALAQFGEDIDAMMALVDRSLELDPSSARGWYVSGVLRLWAGEPELAIEHVENSLRLSPRERLGAHLSVIGTAHLLSRRYATAVVKLLVAIHERPANPPPYRSLACCYAHLGRLDEAREVVKTLHGLTSVVVPRATPFRKLEHQELFLWGLRTAAE